VRNWSWRESAAGENRGCWLAFTKRRPTAHTEQCACRQAWRTKKCAPRSGGMIRRSRFDHVVDEGARAMSREA